MAKTSKSNVTTEKGKSFSAGNLRFVAADISPAKVRFVIYRNGGSKPFERFVKNKRQLTFDDVTVTLRENNGCGTIHLTVKVPLGTTVSSQVCGKHKRRPRHHKNKGRKSA